MALLTQQDLENVMGPLKPSQEALAAFLIGRVTAYLRLTTGCSFEPVIDYVFRAKADITGRILLDAFYPTTDVSNFHDFVSDVDIAYPRWDGISTLYNFHPRQVVDITIDYGFEDAPEDIKGVALEAVRRGMAANATTLKTKTVGDVTYVYGDMFSFSSADQEIIDSYSNNSETTMILDGEDGRYSANTLLQSMIPWANGPDYPYE